MITPKRKTISELLRTHVQGKDVPILVMAVGGKVRRLTRIAGTTQYRRQSFGSLKEAMGKG